MAWTQRFIDALSSRVRQPRFVVDSLGAFGMPAENAAIRWSSHSEPGYTQVITKDGSSLSPASLAVGSWTVSPMRLTLGLTRGVNISALRPGYVVQLRMGFDGWDVADFEPIFIGVLKQVSYRGRRYRAEFMGLEGELHSRWGVGGIYPDQPEVFLGAGTDVTLDVDYLVGATTIDFASSAEPKRATGGLYTVRVTNDAGETFLIQGDTLSSPSAGVTRLENLTFGVMDSDAPSGSFSAGNQVVYVAWDEEHPLRIAQRLVTSTGYGSNGAEDVYPGEWGLSVPASYVDESDWANQRLFAGPLGLSSPSWHLLQEAPATTFGQWLNSFLSDGGFWLCQRQGLLTGRGVQLLDSQDIELYPNQRDIMSIDIDHFAGQLEYIDVRVTDHGGRSASIPNPFDPSAQLSDSVARLVGSMTPRLPPTTGPDFRTTSATVLGAGLWSRPLDPAFRYTLPVFGTTSDRADWREVVHDRTVPYLTRRPESIRVTLNGLHWARATLGDAMGLVTDVINSRRGPNDLITKGGWHTVVAGGMDPFRGTCEFTLLGVPPDDEG